jgi:hypothetical protein
MNQDLLNKAERLQTRAYEVMEELGLTAHWSRVGRVVLVGSVRFGLMASGNIDLEVYVDQPEASQGFGVIGEIASHPGVTCIEYHNFLATDDPGLYWRVDFQDADGVIWDIDNWLVPNSHPHAGLADGLAQAMSEKLTPETRDAILEIKAGLPAEGKVRGIEIYRAVMGGGVRGVEEFRRWNRQHPADEGIETWHPGEPVK